MQVEVLLEESLIYADSRLTIYNSTQKNGVRTLFARAHITKPVASSIILQIRLNPIQSGRFRTAMVVSVPKIAGGDGSITNLSMRLHRTTRDHDRIANLVSLRCLDGRMEVHTTATLRDGTRLRGGVLRPCTAR